MSWSNSSLRFSWLVLLAGTCSATDRFQAADETIIKFMQEHKVHAATFAASQNGQLLHERAFGFADEKLTVPVTPRVRMRIASVSKPFTAAALKSLAQAGKLKLTEPVMKFLPGKPVDERWQKITIQWVLEHKGGWDRAAGDPMFMHQTIMKELKLKIVTPRDAVRWMMTRPLQFEPGTKSVYSNFGYCLLGVVIEEITGESYGDVVKKLTGLDSLTFSSTEPRQRNRDETWYDFGSEGERFLIEPMQAHGGWVCTAADLTRFLDKFWISGDRRTGSRASYMFFGSLPGTTAVAVQRPDGLNYALLVNKRDPRAKWHEELKKILEAALDSKP